MIVKEKSTLFVYYTILFYDINLKIMNHEIIFFYFQLLKYFKLLIIFTVIIL